MAKGKMIFKELERCLLEVRAAYEESKRTSKNGKPDRIIESQYNLLKKIADYVDSCDWLVKEDAKEKMKFIRAHKYDYALIRKELNLTEDAVKTFMKYAIAKVKEKIGETTLELIMEGKIGIATVQFEALSGGKFALETILMHEVFEKLPPDEFLPEVLLDCRKEIEFLHDYSEDRMAEKLKHLDMQKLAFLRYILEKNTPKFAVEKYKLIRLITGNGGVTLESYFEDLEKETAYRPQKDESD